MNYTADEVLEYVREEDVKFIRLAFCDVTGMQKNLSVMPDELPRVFETGCPFYPAAVRGFDDAGSLLLHPDPATLSVLPWRPDHGRVVRMYSAVSYPDGAPHPADTRSLLKSAVGLAEQAGVKFRFGAQQTFYLFKLDGEGNPTKEPHDRAGYMDIAPEDRGENVRREICLTLEQMGIRPESSCHEEGPGQNKIDFRFSDALEAADNAVTFRTVVRTAANRNGLAADFSPKPLDNAPGNGCHINLSVEPVSKTSSALAGILAEIAPMTLFFNPAEASYRRLAGRAVTKIGWSDRDRSGLVWMQKGRAELRSPDPETNPYLAFALLVRAGLKGIGAGETLPEPGSASGTLPASLDEARGAASASGFLREVLPEVVRKAYGAE